MTERQKVYSLVQVMLWLFGSLSSLHILGCATLERSPQSGYSGRSLYETQALNRPLSGGTQTGGLTASNNQSSIFSTHSSTDHSSAAETAIILRRLEKTIEGKKEKADYYRIRHLLPNDADRIHYLKLGATLRNPDPAREDFLRSRGIDGDHVHFNPEIQGLIESGDITLGMSKNAVRAAWGPPEEIDVAGNPIYGNEIWYYSEQITSQDGYQSESRKVTFEGGVVVGWQRK